MKTTEQQARRALLEIADAVVASVKVAGPFGAPAGVVYAALMAHGCTLDQFNQLIGALVSVGKLTRRGNLLFVSGAAS